MTHRLSQEQLLAIWETGVSRSPLDRALVILWAAGVENGADLPLALRDRALLAVRADTFGGDFEARSTCPGCAADLDVPLDAGALAETLPATHGEGLRAITSADLAAVAVLPLDEATSALRDRLAGHPVPAGKEADAVDDAIEAQGRAAELTLKMACSECNEVWSDVLDVAAFVWTEVEASALHLLGEIGELARAFGWTEREILSLSRTRRAAYMSMVRAS